MDNRTYALTHLRDLKARTNDSFWPLYFDSSRYLVLKGGGGSGKSVFAATKVLERCTTEPGHRCLVVRKVARTLRESCFEQLRSMAREYYADSIDFVPSGKGGDMYIRFNNGSEILFAGLDDVEKLKSIYDITMIWIEEASELEESDFNQLDIRLRTDSPHYLQMVLSFNPISITHWLKRRFFDRPDPRARVHESTYKDNRFLTAEAVQTLEAFKDSDEYYYTVYCLGQWGTTGRSVFDAKALSKRLEALKTPTRRGMFEVSMEDDDVHVSAYAWSDDAYGVVAIYKDVEQGRPYVIGADTAGEGSDWFVAQVLDNITGDQVCTMRCQYDEDIFTRQLYCLGRHYNDALISVEVNFSTYPTKLLSMMGYERLYVREVEDTYTGSTRKAFGFKTTSVTRPVIIADLIRIVRESCELINDRDTILEMLTFVRNEKLRPEAEPGAHDDCVMALAIAHYCRPQGDMTITAPQAPPVEWSRHMWDNYYNARDDAERDWIIKMYGRPAGL